MAEGQARIFALEHLTVLLTSLEQRNSGEVFDYSSTQLLAEWIIDALPKHDLFRPISATATTLAQSLALTAGHGQAQIWTLFREGVVSMPVGESALDRLSSLQDDKLRVSVVEAIVSAHMDPEHVQGLHQMLESLIIVTPPSVGAKAWSNTAVIGAIELDALCPTSGRDASKLLISSREVPLGDIAAAQCAQSPAAFFQSLTRFMSRLWHDIDFDSADQGTQGPSVLFKPVRLASVLRFSGSESVKLIDLDEEQRSFKFTVDLALSNTKAPLENRNRLLAVACRVLRMVGSAFNLHVTDTMGLEDLLGTIQLSDIPSPSLRDLSPGDQSIPSIGQIWLSLSRALIELYVTNIPIDPAVRRVLLGDVVSARLSGLEEELAAVEHAEIVTKGISDSQRLYTLRERVRTIALERDNLGPSVERSTDAARLATFFNEIHSFLNDAFSTESVKSLQQSLLLGHAQAAERERGFQLSSVAFVQRLVQNYRDLDDLVAPVVTAVNFGRFGMRLLARALDLRTASASTAVLAATQFPVCVSAHDLMGDTAGLPSTPVELRNLFISATALASRDIPTETSQSLPSLIEKLSALYQAWSAIRQREQQDEQASESLYRVKKTDIEVLSDQEQEEKEFAEMFPTYEEQGDHEADQSTMEEHDDKLRFDSEAVLTFHQLIMASSGRGHASFRRAVDKLLKSDFDAAAFDEQMDNGSLHIQIRHLHDRLRSLQPATSHPNFYTEANEPEVRKVHALLLRLIARLDRLIDDWPDQVVLQHIKDRCLAVLSLQTRSPVAKVLIALEQLLVHTNDWEGYANKENSLAAFQAELSGQIVEWRRLELTSWMRLLDDQVKEYVERDAEWTLRLFGALIQGAATAEDVNKHLETTLPMISTYLSTSSLGHFGARVETLRALVQLSAGIDSPVQARVTTMLHNVVENASLFLPRLLDSLRTQRAVIDKAIKDFVKLASWKDVNVYALKASAVKSHRQLHRNVRKFREVLRQPVAPILLDHNSICPQEAPVSTHPRSPGRVLEVSLLDPAVVVARQQVEPTAPLHLVRLDETFKRFQAIHDQVRSQLVPLVGEALDGMTTDIIETASSLAKATPTTLTKENSKLVNNLASRKRKAYSDMLKALRATGFSNSVRADQLAKQQDSSWIAGLSSLPRLPQGLPMTDIEKIENYHHRLNVLMITLRAAFNGHNPDIASQDLERGIGFSESIYACALVERQK